MRCSGGLRPGARVKRADPGGGGGPGRAVRQPGDVQPQRQWAGNGGDGQHPQHTQTQAEVGETSHHFVCSNKILQLFHTFAL